MSGWVTLQVFIEGFYLGAGQMQASIDPVSFPNLCDTIIVELHNVNSPYSTAFSSKNILSTSGIGNFYFPNTAAGNYYLVIRHRNGIESWSAVPVNISEGTNYNFTNAQNKAYGNNQSNLGDGNFAILSGDISEPTLGIGYQDGIIESQDYSDMENAVSITLQGYMPQDITGDGIVESYLK